MTEDNDSLRLYPPDDRLPSMRRLLRQPEDLSDSQFDLLAAAWADGALGGDALAEMESALAASITRRERAESFRKVRLKPVDDRWTGSKKLLRPSAAVIVLRRSIIPLLAAAAVVAAIIMTGPAATRHAPARAQTPLPPLAGVSEVLIPAPTPLRAAPIRTDISARPPETVAPQTSGQHTPVASDAQLRITPITIEHSAVMPEMIAMTPDMRLAEMSPDTGMRPALQENEPGWILRGITFLARAVTKEEKKIDGYTIANACVTGINTVLGWDMALERVRNSAGEPTAVNFNSSLLSFSAPVNKSSP